MANAIVLFTILFLFGLAINDTMQEEKKAVERKKESMAKTRCEHCLFANREQTYCYKRRIGICYWDESCAEYFPASKTFSPDENLKDIYKS